MKDVGANIDEKNGKENEKPDEEMTEKQSSKVKKIRRIIKSMMIFRSVSVMTAIPRVDWLLPKI